MLAQKQTSARQFIVTTLPLLGVLIYFLVQTARRPNLPIYNLPQNYSNDEWEAAVAQSGLVIGLMDILSAFLVLHVLWTTFAVYIISFIAKRRHLIGRYLAEGELCLGDVVFDKGARFCRGFNEYGYAVYAHPNHLQVVRKRVRVYQPYTRERIAILRLPNRPLSGQCKVDLEIDLSVAAKERDTSHKYFIRWSMFWVCFTLFGSIYVLYMMTRVDDPSSHDVSLASKVLFIVVGLNVPFAFAVNWARFLMYRNWMINRGALINDNGDARKVDHCINIAQSEDGSEDVIPYSILNEEEMSYQGSLPSHSNTIAGYAQPNASDNVVGSTTKRGPLWITLAWVMQLYQSGNTEHSIGGQNGSTAALTAPKKSIAYNRYSSPLKDNIILYQNLLYIPNADEKHMLPIQQEKYWWGQENIQQQSWAQM
jgi:hypothetical protein